MLALQLRMLIRSDQCSWIIVQILMIRRDDISSVTGVLHYNARHFIYTAQGIFFYTA